MPKLLCPCGFVHDLSPIPDDGWETIRSKDLESVQDAKIQQYEIAGHNLPPRDDPRANEWHKLTKFIVEKTGLLYECPECGRLMWRPSKGDSYTIFTKESDPAN